MWACVGADRPVLAVLSRELALLVSAVGVCVCVVPAQVCMWGSRWALLGRSKAPASQGLLTAPTVNESPNTTTPDQACAELFFHKEEGPPPPPTGPPLPPTPPPPS